MPLLPVGPAWQRRGSRASEAPSRGVARGKQLPGYPLLGLISFDRPVPRWEGALRHACSGAKQTRAASAFATDERSLRRCQGDISDIRGARPRSRLVWFPFLQRGVQAGLAFAATSDIGSEGGVFGIGGCKKYRPAAHRDHSCRGMQRDCSELRSLPQRAGHLGQTRRQLRTRYLEWMRSGRYRSTSCAGQVCGSDISRWQDGPRRRFLRYLFDP